MVDRVAQLLELAAERPDGATLSELAKDLSAPVSSIQGLLNGLVATGLLDRNGARYLLGPLPYILTLKARQHLGQMIVHQDLVRLAEEGGFTVLLGVRIGDDIVSIDEAGNHPYLEYLAKSRAHIHLLASVAGRAMVAAMRDDEMHDLLRRSDRDDLVREFMSEISSIREAGVAFSVAHDIVPRPGYPEPETGVVAAAVVDASGRVVGSICIGHDLEYFAQHRGRMAEVLLRHVRHWQNRRSLDDPVPQPGEVIDVGAAPVGSEKCLEVEAKTCNRDT